MVKVKKSTRKGAKTDRSRMSRIMKQPSRAIELDAYAKRYAQLLANPCGAALAHPLYAGSDAGILVRTEVTGALAESSATAGFFHWVPGAISSNGANALSGTTITFGGSATANISSTFVPGLTFMKAQAAAVRCVAACLQVTYLGTELNRSGMVIMGRSAGDYLKVGTSYTSSDVETGLEHFTRTPGETIELVWVPGMQDQEFVDPNSNITADDLTGRAGLSLAFYGLQAGSGLRCRMVAVYEYKPIQGTGVVYNSSSRALSRNSLDHVLNVVQSTTNKLTRIAVGAYNAFDVATKIAGLAI